MLLWHFPKNKGMQYMNKIKLKLHSEHFFMVNRELGGKIQFENLVSVMYKFLWQATGSLLCSILMDRLAED